MLLLGVTQTGKSQKWFSSKQYLKRAEEMYSNIWKRYRVDKYKLFSENFPSGKQDSLTYLQGGSVNEKKLVFYGHSLGCFQQRMYL
jgi:hypothetical protein